MLAQLLVTEPPWVEGIGFAAGCCGDPRRKRPRAESAGEPRGMGARVYMARKACTPPCPQTKP